MANEQLIESVSAKCAEKCTGNFYAPSIAKHIAAALRDYATALASQPYTGEATPEALQIEADRQEEAGNAEGAALLRACGEKWAKLDKPVALVAGQCLSFSFGTDGYYSGIVQAASLEPSRLCVEFGPMTRVVQFHLPAVPMDGAGK